MKLRALFAAATLALAGSAANAAVIYSNDFESGSTANLSGTFSVEGTHGFSADGFGTKFARSGAGNSIVLTLSGLEIGSDVNVSFDLAAIDSWDGAGASCCGEDHFEVLGLLDIAIGIALGGDSGFTSEVSEIGSTAHRGFSGSWGDRAFAISLDTFTAVSETLVLTFAMTGPGVQELGDESFAIDNIVVDGTLKPGNPNVVPLPAGLPLLLAGLGTLGLVRRSRRA